MGKKRRDSILRRPEPASATSVVSDAVVENNVKVVVAAAAASDGDKENQAMGSGSGTDSEGSGPVTRKKTKNRRRVSFGAHIACKDMDTGRITNLKIPHPSFNLSASLAPSNASLGSGSLTSTNVPAQVQEIEMSLDDSSMGMNQTTVMEASSDSMDLSLLQTSGSGKSVLTFGSAHPKAHSIASSAGNFEPDETNDSLVSTFSAICPPGITGKLNIPTLKKLPTAEEELDALDDNAGVDAGFLASMRRVSRGKVVANRKTSLDSKTIQDIVDIIHDDNTLGDDDDDDDMEVETSVRGAMAIVDGLEPSLADVISSLDDHVFDGDGQPIQMESADSTLINESGSSKVETAASKFDMDLTRMSKTMKASKADANLTSLMSVDKATASRLDVDLTKLAATKADMDLTDISIAEQPVALAFVDKTVASKFDMDLTKMDKTAVSNASVDVTDISVEKRPTTLSFVDKTVASKFDMELTKMDKMAVSRANVDLTDISIEEQPAASAFVDKTLASKFDMELTKMDKTLVSEASPSTPLKMVDASRDVDKSGDETLLPPTSASTSASPQSSSDVFQDSLLAETSFRRSSRLRSKPASGGDNVSLSKEPSPAAKKISAVASAVTSAAMSVATSAATSAATSEYASTSFLADSFHQISSRSLPVNVSVSMMNVSSQRTTRSRAKIDDSLMTSDCSKLDASVEPNTSQLAASARTHNALVAGKGRKKKSKRHSKSRGDGEISVAQEVNSVKEVVDSMAEVSLREPSLPHSPSRPEMTESHRSRLIALSENSTHPSNECVPLSVSSTAPDVSTVASTAPSIAFSAVASTTASTISTTIPTNISTTSTTATSQPNCDPCPPEQRSNLPVIPPESFWLNPQPTETAPCQPSPRKKSFSAGIIDEEMPMMTFDVGGETGGQEPDDQLESSVAVIKDLSSLAALSFVDPTDSLVELLARCRIDVAAIDKKWNEEIVPLFDHHETSPDTTSVATPHEDRDSFKEMVLRSHLGEARHLSSTCAFNAFKGQYFVKVALLSSLIEKIQSEATETPGFLHEWLDGDEETKRSVETRVRRMFKLYESQDYKSKVGFLAQCDQHFLENVDGERETLAKLRRDLRATRSKVEALLEEAEEVARTQEGEISKRHAEEARGASLEELRKRLEKSETSKNRAEEEWKRKKEGDAESKKTLKRLEEVRNEREGRKKRAVSAKEKLSAVKNRLALHYDAKDRHPWKLENFHLGPGGFFFFRFPRWKFCYDVSLGATTPSDGAAFHVASARLSCGRVKRGVATTTTAEGCFGYDDLDSRLPLMLHQMAYGEESQRTWMLPELKDRLTDIVGLLHSCAKLKDVFERLTSFRRRKEWFQTPGFVTEEGKLYLTVHVRRGLGGDWPLALLLKFLLTPATENPVAAFYSQPFDDRLSLDNWPEWSKHRLDVDVLKASILSKVEIEETDRTRDVVVDGAAPPPFHRFVLAAFAETENFVDEKYAELYGDRSELSMDVAR